MSSAVIVGVDPGVKGAVAWWDGSEMRVDHLPIRTDHTLDSLAFVTRLMEWEPVLLVTEATFRPLPLVRFCGEVLACGKVVGAAVELVAVASWKKRQTGTVSKDKKLSIAACQAKYPNLNLIPPKCRVPSDDWSEAVLICDYGIMLYEGKL